jgi:hypothetical protein
MVMHNWVISGVASPWLGLWNFCVLEIVCLRSSYVKMRTNTFGVLMLLDRTQRSMLIRCSLMVMSLFNLGARYGSVGHMVNVNSSFASPFKIIVGQLIVLLIEECCIRRSAPFVIKGGDNSAPPC